jgi:hypothetical protein
MADAPLPGNVKEALSNLGRFDHLEIGALPPKPAPQAHVEERILCTHCGQPNEKARQTCWACFQPLGPEAAKPAPKGPKDITIVLDGITYRSSDPNLPADLRVLMDQIHEKGYSEELLAQWRTWRATRNEPNTAPSYPDPALVPVENRGKDPLTGNEVFKGQRSSVIRLDGKVYTSDDTNIAPEIKELFGYIEAHGVTPALMEHLRQIGNKATVRPATTPAPSAEDLAFWKEVAKPEIPAGPRMAVGLIMLGLVAVFVLLRFIFGGQ